MKHGNRRRKRDEQTKSIIVDYPIKLIQTHVPSSIDSEFQDTEQSKHSINFPFLSTTLNNSEKSNDGHTDDTYDEESLFLPTNNDKGTLRKRESTTKSDTLIHSALSCDIHTATSGNAGPLMIDQFISCAGISEMLSPIVRRGGVNECTCKCTIPFEKEKKFGIPTIIYLFCRPEFTREPPCYFNFGNGFSVKINDSGEGIELVKSMDVRDYQEPDHCQGFHEKDNISIASSISTRSSHGLFL